MTIKRAFPATLNLLAALAIAGCGSLQSSYAPPGGAIPAQWSAPSTAQAAGGPRDAAQRPLQRVAPQDAWWTQFHDADLNRLIELALRNNADLVTAAWNIRLARLNAGLADDKATPSLGASLGTNASHDFDTGSTSRSYSSGLNLSYEVDLWGKIASQRDAAQWRLEATRYDLQTTATTLVASVATLYWQLAWQNEQIASGEQSLAHVRRTRQLVQAQYDAGDVSGLEVQEARRSVASQESALAQLRQERVATLNALAVLLNQPPSGEAIAGLLPQEPKAMPQTRVPDLPAGLPAEILQRRPDLQAAETRLRATLADGDATRTSYYPGISLTGGLSSASTALGNLLSNPVGTLAASLSLPFLNATEMRLNNEISRATYESAVVAFQQTLHTALQEVEDALGARQQLQTQAQWLEEQLDAARRVESLNEVRYRAGATALKSWLDAQESRRSAELAVSSNRLNQLVNQLTLYKALGGDAVFEAPAIASDTVTAAAP